MMNRYILDGKSPVLAPDLLTWAKWLEDTDRKVAVTQVGDATISTVFLGVDHQFGDGDPLLFETLVFGGQHDQEMWRCSTWSEAEEQHRQACDFVIGSAVTEPDA